MKPRVLRRRLLKTERALAIRELQLVNAAREIKRLRARQRAA